MKRILASLFCVALLAGPGMAHCGECGVSKAKPAATKSCCAKKAAKKSSCCDKAAAAGKSECCGKKLAKKECGPSCKMTNTWMTEPSKCKKCETASL